MAGARVPGHRGPSTKTPIATAYIVKLYDGPKVFEIPILHRTTKMVRIERCVGSDFDASFGVEHFDHKFSASREDAIERWRTLLQAEADDYRERIAAIENLLSGPGPKDAAR